MQKIKTFLWYDTQAEEAANLYIGLFPDSKITGIHRYPEGGPGAPGDVMVVDFQLAGQAYVALNAGPEFSFTEAISLQVETEDQAETDDLWTKLTANGGEEGPCGWLKDKYGLSWQITPRRLTELTSDSDPGRARRAMAAMMTMKKIDIQGLEDAAA